MTVDQSAQEQRIPTPEASAWGRAGAHISWSRTENRTARTQNARDALRQKFLDACGGDEKRAEHAWKAHFASMAAKSVAARRKKTTER